MRKAMSATMGYRIDALNADHDLGTMLSGLNHHPQARLCLYGPPGTGKTALGHHMAEVLNMPLLVKRASDLLDALVGKTEHNIAKMFREANKERAILMLDEADSFLRDRKGAKRSWEVTQVNELLTQMESYEGIFICSTNLMNDLDEASIRRFDFKIKLDYLKPGQALLLFRQALKDMGSSVPGAGSPWQQKLSRLSNLTPGDFALVLRQHRIVADSLTASTLYTALEKESRFKQGDHAKAGIGFTAALRAINITPFSKGGPRGFNRVAVITQNNDSPPTIGNITRRNNSPHVPTE
jgi:SpoVK/Ycf46/Vps4 family AAA+-type ATPase